MADRRKNRQASIDRLTNAFKRSERSSNKTALLSVTLFIEVKDKKDERIIILTLFCIFSGSIQMVSSGNHHCDRECNDNRHFD